jgi:Reverse transcriptase (RNA-dependent DNA polymerase)
VFLYITHIFNNCLRLCYFPKRWKHAKVVAIPKPNKDPTIIPIEQFGFSAGLSNHQLLRIVTQILHKLANDQSTGMIFFDFEKAFDSVWHGGLIYKLYCLEYPRYLHYLIYSYLEGRSFQVFMNKTFSSQGPVLSPSLIQYY